MPTRDYKAEYRRRIERGLARGLSRSQARGHPKTRETSARLKPVRADARLDNAILNMNRGQSMSAAARDSHVSTERLRRFLTQEQLGEIKGRRWVVSDARLRRVPVLSRGRQHAITTEGYESARLAGLHFNAVGNFVRTNEIGYLKPFEGKSVRSARGKEFPLETDPNELHRIAAMDEPPFHEIYQIVSTD